MCREQVDAVCPLTRAVALDVVAFHMLKDVPHVVVIRTVIVL